MFEPYSGDFTQETIFKKVIRKEKVLMNQKKAGVLLSYGQTILSTLISLTYTPVMLRLLGQSE